MDAVLILADSAQQSEPGGKVHILGAGWSVTGPAVAAGAVVVFLWIPWDQTNEPHEVVLSLLDADGHVVLVPGPEGDVPLRIPNTVQVGRPAATPDGTPIDASFVVNYGPGLPLTPGERYTWQLEIDGESKEHWSRGFLVRPVSMGLGGVTP
ncbi:DUF6941 family protein [Motilibacter deserti]|uniref:Inclusion body protein n=1 Tax=Motilibacter deserti TaxID=2714956 RepID=A0ABX0GSE1_9ACTN|nr:hypothetical protein [Motilibacter deserti]NHC12632.1 hypothetical protein [Motilibacter deserti]